MARRGNDLISWSNRLACGIKIIDDQHKGLVNLVNEMFNHATGNVVQEHNYFNTVIQEVVKYVKVHFATEEKIMLSAKFSGYLEHKKKHDSFILSVVDNISDYKAGKRLSLSNFTKFLKEWILSHIALMDKQYFEYLKSIARRKDDGTLSISEEDVR